jgi:hypothetical protein
MRTRRRFKVCTLAIASALAFLAAAPGAHADEAKSGAPARCGNGIFEAGETCSSCPADCAVHPCDPAPTRRTVTVSFTPPSDVTVAGTTLFVGYRSGVISLPGSGSAASVKERLKDLPAKAIVAVNDLDYGIRVVLSRSDGFAAGKVFTIEFDRCAGAAEPTAADVSCIVEGCATVFGPASGCACTAVPDEGSR